MVHPVTEQQPFRALARTRRGDQRIEALGYGTERFSCVFGVPTMISYWIITAFSSMLSRGAAG